VVSVRDVTDKLLTEFIHSFTLSFIAVLQPMHVGAAEASDSSHLLPVQIQCQSNSRWRCTAATVRSVMSSDHLLAGLPRGRSLSTIPDITR